MPEPSPRLRTSTHGDVIVAEPMDQKILDEASISQLSQELFALAAGQDKPALVLDFVNVGHMSSSALGMLITLHKRVREKNGRLWLCGIKPSIYEVFEITRLNEVFTIRDSRAAALEEAGAAPTG
jgi:anti-sigma B factor antagonist